MDSGSGHIYEQRKVDMKSIKGKLVPWEVGEEVVIKECKFKVKEIKVFPADEIILVGMPHDVISKLFEASEELPDDTKEEPSQVMRDFIRNKK